MGILDDAASIISAKTTHSKRSKSYRSSRHKERSRSRDRDRDRERSRSRHRSSRSAVGVGGGISGIAASIFGGGDDDRDRDHHRRSSHSHGGHREKTDHDGGERTRSFFGLPNTSRSSFFSNFGRSHSHTHPTSSFYRRSPRPGFLSRALKKLRRLLRDLVYYAKRHPLKVFMLVLMPLITGGALTALLARFGLRLPPVIERMLGLAARAGAAGDPSMGLVGEAVRMVSGGGGGGAAAAAAAAAAGMGGAGARYARASYERGRDGAGRWEKRSFERDGFLGGGDGGSRGGGGGGWGDGLKGISKFFS